MEFITYRKATLSDIPLLVKSRLHILRSANQLTETVDMSFIEEKLTAYYEQNLTTENHIAYLAFHNDAFAGTGGVCFYQVLPTYHNPTGWKAYIINMYTVQEFRKKGIGTKILDLLVKESFQKNIRFIALEATEMGRPIYEKYGFIPMLSEMQLNNETYG